MKINVIDKVNSNTIDLISGENLFNGENAFNDHFGETTSLEIDLLNVASGIFAADLGIKRNELEDYIRTIEISIEVVNVHAFERIKDLLEEALFVLSSDNWTIKFVPVDGKPEESKSWPDKKGTVLLFSGGLDSLSGVVHYKKQNSDLALVSHINQNRVVKDSQSGVLELLNRFYKTDLDYYPYRVFGRNKGEFLFPTDVERENTQRTRSFLFLSLAALTARRIGFRKIISIAENGQFAIHLPLNPSRVGPFSTHTANPKFIDLAKEIFMKLLSLDGLEIVNPFLYKTKGEVVGILDEEIANNANKSISCWKASRVSAKNHCGECIPCLSRRISLEYNGVYLDEYSRDLLKENISSLPPDDNGKRNLIDFLEFISKFKGYKDSDLENLLIHFPDLYNESIDEKEALRMYSRLSKQAYDVFDKYPEVKKVM
ncbi:7-cyano-7-deazaguanine synthase [Allomuricauda sp. SCSIO 65647]|uniref:7-cyano-7-deazaguanine synthase n=1 Tax=Allomuricauda sp. SCSIO 65647 TaxID=2908843 RepID=UPI001F3956C6|nr:7-cyano-7-deazaguanine synthase [Muricauda sp. SCSIO 65647]UJH67381.1 7-cyano-7-deazaguanine synthase [Muricauda sp. SCSIO 65647]